MRNRRSFLIALFALVVAGCSSSESVVSAEAAVARFRSLMSAQEYARIYAEASPEFKHGVPESQLLKFLGAVSSKLGSVKSSEKATWNINVHTSGTFVTLGYKTEFEKGAATEQFIYQVKDGAAILMRYDINSPALLIN